MGVRYFREIHDGRRGSDSVDRESASLSMTRVFRIGTSSNWDDYPIIMAEANRRGLFIGARHPRFPLAFLRDRNCDNESFSKKIWRLTCTYSSEFEVFDNPLFDPAEIYWDTEQFQRVAEQDVNGNAIVNSAGDPFDPPPMMDDSRTTVLIRKNLAFVPAWILSYKDSVNSGDFVVDGIAVGAGQAKVQDVQVSPIQERNDVRYRVVSLMMHLRDDGWQLNLLDQGFRIKNGANRENALNDGDQLEPTQPILLDGSGGRLSDPSTANAVFLTFNVYQSRDFSLLPLR